MILSRARFAAAAGAALLLVAAFPLLGVVQRAGDLGNLSMVPVLVVYLFGGILAGGVAGVWLYRKLDWSRRSSHQLLGLIVGAVLGATMLGGGSWAGIVVAAGVVGLMGVGAGSIYWLLDVTVKEPVRRPYL